MLPIICNRTFQLSSYPQIIFKINSQWWKLNKNLTSFCERYILEFYENEIAYFTYTREKERSINAPVLAFNNLNKIIQVHLSSIKKLQFSSRLVDFFFFFLILARMKVKIKQKHSSQRGWAIFKIIIAHSCVSESA